MSEIVTKRVGRIISGSFNAMVDAIEDAAPEIVMEQAIREVDSAVDEVRSELGKVIANKHLATKRLAEKTSKHEDLTKKLETAIDEERDDLAEAAISAQLDMEAQIPILEQAISDASDKEDELEGYVTALQAKKREMKEELKNFVDTRKESGNSGSASDDSSGGAISSGSYTYAAEKAGSAFDRVLEKHTGLPSSGNTDSANAAKLDELDTISRENQIKERLEAAKSNKDS